MAEDKKKVSSGSYQPQSAVTIGRNKRLKGERHAKRMAAQMSRRADDLPEFMPKVPRGTARAKARVGLHARWLERQS